MRVTNRAPVAQLSASPNPATIKLFQPSVTVRFDASSSADEDGSVVNYKWDLDGNGSFETDTRGTEAASRSYPDDGRFNVRLRVEDNDGATNDAAVNVLIGEEVAIASVGHRWRFFRNYTLLRSLTATNLERGGDG